MSTKKQHFVPRVYLKNWETNVESSKEPDKKFTGIYFFNNSNVGEGVNKNTIFWKPHLYTINFKYLFISNSCPKVKKEFTNLIYELLKSNFKQPVYGKCGYSIIKTKKSIEKHIFEIDDWEFYYYDGTIAKKRAILEQIEALNCYILEDAFDNFFEKEWEYIYKEFITSVHNVHLKNQYTNEIKIPVNVANNMIKSFFIMLCRNPKFDAMGVYSKIKNNLLYPFYFSFLQENDESIIDEANEAKTNSDIIMNGIWYTELYKIFFKNSGGFYHGAISVALKGCQMVLFEAKKDAGFFITSDNPAFEHKIAFESKNLNGMFFPLSPKHLILFTQGNAGGDIVGFRFADRDTIKHLNRIITHHKTESIIAVSKNLYNSI